MRKATWGLLAGVIGSAVGAALLTRWRRRFTAERMNPDLGTDADYTRMAEGIV